jgi:SpoVK/Ycf46/Vps4 family AAA+-type ATPase
VPLDEYAAVVKGQTVARISVDPPRLREALQNLVIDPRVLNRLGPAVNSGRSIFLYGPSGNGKTTIGEALGRLMVGHVFIPYAIEVGGHIIKVYDSLIHKAVPDDAIALPAGKRPDRRWVLCRRPLVMAGGELIMESLDLVYEEVAKYYEAPFQMKANGGLFLMDDFGRQQVRPRDLLNRWIVPLEKRVDFLALHTGKKIEVPFDVLIVFATNIAPRELVDEAFLRRIRHKIEIVNPTLDEFRQIMQRVCASKDVPFSLPGFQYLIQEHYTVADRDLKAVHPRDVIDQIVDIAEYQRVRPEMTKELIDEACSSYFVKL